MNKKISFKYLILTVVLSGCGITGGVSSFSLDYPSFIEAGGSDSINSIKVSSAEDAGINQAIGAYNIGRFGDAETKVIEESLEASLRRLVDHENEAGYRIHVHIHRYAMSFSNNRVAILAIVDWCVAREDQVLFSEVFYAANDTGQKIFGSAGTLGENKNKINRAIIKQICDKTLGELYRVPFRSTGPEIYFTQDEARAALPEVMTGGTSLVGNLVLSGGSGETFFEELFYFNPVDWTSVLDRQDS